MWMHRQGWRWLWSCITLSRVVRPGEGWTAVQPLHYVHRGQLYSLYCYYPTVIIPAHQLGRTLQKLQQHLWAAAISRWLEKLELSTKKAPEEQKYLGGWKIGTFQAFQHVASFPDVERHPASWIGELPVRYLNLCFLHRQSWDQTRNPSAGCKDFSTSDSLIPHSQSVTICPNSKSHPKDR